ncbi:hypothetical protein AB0A76_24365 [Streptomyces exfoliatus]|uniref:Uncharacterized protein n=1 Tax=Streptomyces exfoliatus TaxID=1905 RepID=A0ABV3D339_STREX
MYPDEVIPTATEKPEPPVDPKAEPAVDTKAAPEEPDATAESGDEAIRTLLSTAATERPVEEVASLVARLQETGQLSSPADVALRAAAVSRPLDEVRQLLALLNESGYDLQQAETTLRAAAVGRPIEDVVQLVGILGADSGDRRSTAGGDDAEERRAGAGEDGRVKTGKDGVPVVTSPKRARGPAKKPRSALDGALAVGPGSHTVSPALRSALRWPAAVALIVCGFIQLPTDLAGVRSGAQAETLSVVVTVLCLVCGVWLAVRDTMIVWAAAAGLAIGLIALHALASARSVDLLNSSLGSSFAAAKAITLLCAAAVLAMAGSALVRHTRPTGAADSA